MANAGDSKDVEGLLERLGAAFKSDDPQVRANLLRSFDLVEGLVNTVLLDAADAGSVTANDLVSAPVPAQVPEGSIAGPDAGGDAESQEPAKEAVPAFDAKAALAIFEKCWTRTLAEQLASLCEACASLPLRPLTLGIVECRKLFSGRVADALEGVATDDLTKFGYRTVVHDAEVLAKKRAYDTGAKMQAAVRAEMLGGNAVVLCTTGNLPPAVMAMASWKVGLEDVNPRILSLARLVRAEGIPLVMPDGAPFEDRWPAGRHVPYERLHGVVGWLRDAVQAGGAVTEDALSRLRDIAEIDIPEGPGIAPGGPRTFDEVPGLHPRTRSRLGVLLKRMQGASDSPPGILLVGPPGTGKTMLAGLLAQGTGRAFVDTSASEWVAAGHLGDTLALMRSKFAEARARAPSLIFIDELDSMGRRGGNDRNEQWTRMFINCLLECLQGLGGRGDVAIVAATNHAASIDPAIVREGRIGEHVEVPLPNRTGRREVLDFYLPKPLREQVDTLVLADRVGRCSPAKIKALAEEAVLQGQGEPTPEDLEKAFGVMAGRLAKGHDPASLALPVCSGLAGEALMTVLAYGGQARVDGISARPGLDDLGRVSVTHRGEEAPSATAGDIRRLLHVAVAPGVARSLVAARLAKGKNPMAALDVFSPVTETERFLAQAHAEAMVQAGIVETGVAKPWERQDAADVELSDARRQVRRVLSRCLPTLTVLTEVLMRDGGVGAERFARIVGLEAGDRATMH